MRTMESQKEDHHEDRTALTRDQSFHALRAAMPPANMEAALRCSARLKAALPHTERLDRNLVLLAYGGGKERSYTLAFVPAMQRSRVRRYAATFRLGGATTPRPRRPRAVPQTVEP